MVLAWNCSKVAHKGFGIDPFAEGPLICWFVMLVGLLMVFVGRKKEEYTCFKSGAGVTVLSVARNSKDTEIYDSFIAELQKQIIESRGGVNKSEK